MGEILLEKIEIAMEKSFEFFVKNEFDLSKFWINVASSYKIKFENLKICDA